MTLTSKKYKIPIITITFLFSICSQSLTADPLTNEENQAELTETVVEPVVNKNPETDETISPPPASEENVKISAEDMAQKKDIEELKKGLSLVFKYEHFKKSKELGRLALTHPVPRIRVAAILALGRQKKGSPYMMKAIDQDGEMVLQAAYEALAMIGPKSAIRYFIRGTGSSDLKIRTASFEGIGKTRDPAGRQLIIEEGIKSDNILVVQASLKGLAWYGNPEDLETISSYLSNSDNGIYQSALDALAIHKSLSTLYILENEFFKNPGNAEKILQSIAGKKNIQSTLLLVKLMIKTDSESTRDLIAGILNQQKRYGKFAYITSPEAVLLQKPNERSKQTRIMQNLETGVYIKQSPLRYIVKRENIFLEDNYHQISFPYLSQDRKTYRGWIFGKDIKIITVRKPSKVKILEP